MSELSLFKIIEKYSHIGNEEILNNYKLAFFCSQKCPPEIILKSYDKAIEWRDKDVCIISGFHTSVEKDVLHYLLKGEQPIIICPARSLENYRITPEIKNGVDKGRILFISKFQNKRISNKISLERNLFAVDIANEIFIAYSEPEGKTERVCEYAKHLNKTLNSF